MEDNRHKLFYVLCAVLYLSVFLVAGCGGNSFKKITFSHTDIEGRWRMVGLGYQYFSPFGSYGALNLQASGEVSEGEVNNIGMDIQRLVGGRLNITEQGAVNGSIDTFLPDSGTNEEYMIHSGQMTPGRDIIVYAGDFPMRGRGIGILIRGETNFSASDLEGTWVFPLDGIFSVSIDANGAITNCNFLGNKGESGRCTGKSSITPQGHVSVQIEVKSGKIFQLNLDGQMGSSKGSMILAGGISTRFEGAAALAARRYGTFSLADGEGSWRFFRASPGETLYGTVIIDSSGAVTGGHWEGIGPKHETFTEGRLSVTDGGAISGHIATSTGNTYTILGGQMSSNKYIAIGLDRDNYGKSGVAVLVKIPLMYK